MGFYFAELAFSEIKQGFTPQETQCKTQKTGKGFVWLFSMPHTAFFVVLPDEMRP